MNQIERLYKIEQMLSESSVVPIETLLERLEISRATFKRDLDYLRDRRHAPIVWDRGLGGYRFDGSSGHGTRAGPKHELPGLWFNSSEAYALLAMQQLLKEIEPGLLAGQVEPLKTRLRALLGSTDHDVDQVEKRITVVQVGARHANPALFAEVANAVLSRRKIRIAYFSRGTGEDCDRTISPQRLVNYRGSWYVDAWCHLRQDLRSFSVDSIRKADVLNDRAKTVAEKELREYFETSYGIFRGKATRLAKLRFTPARARWVAGETWHAQQKGSFEKDGSYVLEVPYHDDRELVMDVLRHGADVEVLGPAELRRAVVAQAREVRKFGDKTHNFAWALPEHFAEQAGEMMNSRYNLEFLGIGQAVKERELEDRLIDRLQQCILELGFCFVGRQYHLALGRKAYLVDLLFYPRFLKELVAFDLKIGAFEPGYAGKMDFYLNLLNDRERAADDQASIGIILCAEKDDVEVEYALKSKVNPIGVAEYQLQARLPEEFKGRLPTARQLAGVVRGVLPSERRHRAN